MTTNAASGQIERIAEMERELADARKAAAKSLRAARKAAGLSLRAVQPKARYSIATLSELENGRTWNTRLAARLVKVYESKAA